MLKCPRRDLLLAVALTMAALPAGPAWHAEVFLGTAWTRPATLTLSQPAYGTRLAFEEVRLETRAFESPPYYGGRLGRRASRGLAFELELVHLKVYADPAQRVRVTGRHRSRPVEPEIRLGEVVQRYSVSHGVNLLLLNAAWARRVAPSLRLEARLGLGPTVPHTESTVDSEAQQQYEWGRPAWQIALGARRNWRRWGAHLEYKHTRTRQRGRVADGEMEVLLRSHHLALGIGVRF